MSKNMYVNNILIVSTIQRVFMKNIQFFLSQGGVSGVNPTQALIIYHIGKNRVKVNEIIKNHFYEGSNPSYNLKKMLEADYLKKTPSLNDRRVLWVSLSEKGGMLHQEMEDFFQKQMHIFYQMGFSEQRWGQWLDEGQHLAQAWIHRATLRPE